MNIQPFTILAIDDSQLYLVELRTLLSDVFPEAIFLSAQSGKEGIAMCQAEKPDIVLLDILMPGMDGYEVCHTIKSDPQLKHIPVVILTVSAVSATNRIKALQSGADAFLAKPVDKSELSIQIKTMILLKESEDRKILQKEHLESQVRERTEELEQELQERKKVEAALQSTLIEMEKSRLAELNLMEDLRNEIVQRRNAEEKVHENLAEQQLIAEVAKKLASIKSKDELYQYIGERIYALAGNAYVYVGDYNNETHNVHVKYLFGFGDMLGKIKKTFKIDAYQISVPFDRLTPKQQSFFKSAAMVNLADDGLYALSAGTVQKNICKTLEILLGINDINIVGFTSEDKYFGAVGILSKEKKSFKQHKLVENLAGQASIALQKLNGEAELRQEHSNMHAILSASPVAMLVIDEKERIIDANHAACQLFNQVFLDLQDNFFADFTACVHRSRNGMGCNFSSGCGSCNIARAIKTSLVSRQKVLGQEERIIRHSGNGPAAVWINFSIEPLVINGHQHIIMALHDNTINKLAEEALVKSEQMYRLLADNVSDVIWSMDNELRYTYISPSILQLLGLSQEEAMQEDFKKSMTPASLMLVNDNIIKNQQEESRGFMPKPFVIEIQQKHKNGSLIWVEISVHAIYDAKGKRRGVTGVSRNITTRKRAEIALSASEQKYRKLHESMMDGFVLVNMKGLIIDYNESYKRILGYSDEELHLITYRDLTPEKWHAFEQLIVTEQVLMRGYSDIYEKEYRKKDGTIIPVEMHAFLVKNNAGENEGMWAIVRDITDRKARELILENERMQLRTLVETIPDLIWLKDPEGRYILCNHVYEYYFGSSEAEIKGKTDFEFEPKELAEFYHKRDLEVLTLDGVQVYQEWITCHADGQQRLFDLTKAPMYGAGRQLIGVLSVARDITVVHQTQESLREREEIYSTIVNQANDSIVLIDFDTQVFVEFNDTACLSHGYSRDEFAKIKLLDLTANLEQDDLRKNLNEAKENKVSVFETKHRTKNGQEIDLRVSTHYITIRGKGYLAAIWSDMTEKNRNEKLLSEKDLIFQSLLDNSPVYITFKDHHFKTLHVSRNFEQLIGKPLADILGNDTNELLYPPEQARRMIAEDQRILNLGTLVEADEELNGRFYTTIKFPIQRSDAPPMLASFSIDLTDRKHAEGALRDSETRLRTLVQTIPDLIWLKDTNGAYLFCNTMFGRFFGASETDIVGKTDYDFVDRELADSFRDYDRKAMEADKPSINEEWVNFANDGHRALLETIKMPMRDSGGTLMGILGIGRDITARSQAELALRESEALYRDLVERLPEGVYKSTHEGKFVDINPAMVSMLGYESKAELMAVDIKTQLYFSPADRENVVLHENCIEMGVHRMKKKDGSEIWIEDHRWYTLDSVGGVLFQEGIIRDITDRKYAQDEIILLNAALEQRVKQRTLELENANKELETFSYSVSHDLRAPLRGIDGWSLALLEDYSGQLDETGRRYLERVRQESQRMGDLIDALLKLSRVNRFEMKKSVVDISAMAQSIANRLHESHTVRQCEFIIEPGLAGECDPQMVEIALTNLFDNAFKFTGTRAFAKIEMGILHMNDVPTYFVRDNGVGFEMEYAKKLFGAFQRMHKQSEFPGTGIGLATVQRIIARHGGRIWAESKPGEGTTFYFTLSYNSIP